MGLLDFFKSGDAKKKSVDLTDFKFLSDDHTRIEKGKPTSANNKGAWRGIRIKTSDNATFFVTMYNMNETHPVWGNNIQMAEKCMKIVEESIDKIVFRGHGRDAMGASFADYGLTLHKVNGNVNEITLHMYDRNIDIVYKKGIQKEQVESLNQVSDFDNFISFTYRWNANMPMDEKMMVAIQSDNLNNQGANAYESGDLYAAIKFFEQALKIMPNNDDALKNLKLCYSKVGNQEKVREVVRKLNHLGE